MWQLCRKMKNGSRVFVQKWKEIISCPSKCPVNVSVPNTFLTAPYIPSSPFTIHVLPDPSRMFATSTTIAIPDGPWGCDINSKGDIFVACPQSHRVIVVTSKSQFSFGSEGTKDGLFQYPYHLCIDALDRVYVCDTYNHRVQVFDSSGHFLFKFGEGQLSYPMGITVNSKNHLVVCDSGNHRVQIFDKSGVNLLTFGTEGTQDAQFRFPNDVVMDNADSIHATCLSKFSGGMKEN